jgi:hypothetical protein
MAPKGRSRRLREILRGFTGFTGFLREKCNRPCNASQSVVVEMQWDAIGSNVYGFYGVLFPRGKRPRIFKNRESLEEPQLRVLRVFSSQSTCNAIQSDAHCTDIEYALQFTGFTGNLTGFYRIYGKSYGLLRVLRENAIGRAMRRNQLSWKCNGMQSEAMFTGFTGFCFPEESVQGFLKNRKVLAITYFRSYMFYGIFWLQSTCSAFESDAHCTDIEYALQFTGFTGNLTGFYRIYGENAIGRAMRRNQLSWKCNEMQSEAMFTGFTVIFSEESFPRCFFVFYFKRCLMTWSTTLWLLPGP